MNSPIRETLTHAFPRGKRDWISTSIHAHTTNRGLRTFRNRVKTLHLVFSPPLILGGDPFILFV